MRQDKKRTAQNKALKADVKELLKKAMKEKTPKAVQAFYKVTDKAAKKHVLHKNKAARLKSRVAKLLVSSTAKKAEKPAKKTASK